MNIKKMLSKIEYMHKLATDESTKETIINKLYDLHGEINILLHEENMRKKDSACIHCSSEECGCDHA